MVGRLTSASRVGATPDTDGRGQFASGQCPVQPRVPTLKPRNGGWHAVGSAFADGGPARCGSRARSAGAGAVRARDRQRPLHDAGVGAAEPGERRHAHRQPPQTSRLRRRSGARRRQGDAGAGDGTVRRPPPRGRTRRGERFLLCGPRRRARRREHARAGRHLRHIRGRTALSGAADAVFCWETWRARKTP